MVLVLKIYYTKIKGFDACLCYTSSQSRRVTHNTVSTKPIQSFGLSSGYRRNEH